MSGARRSDPDQYWSTPIAANPEDASANAVVPRRALPIVPGLALAGGLAVVATVIGQVLPLLGAPVAGIVLGVLVAVGIGPRERLRPGLALGSRQLLQVAVVLLGCQLSLREIADVGGSSLPVMLGTVVVCLLTAQFVGRRMGVDADLRVLIGVGTGICGASAIAAVSPVIKARNTQIAYAISTIFLFNIAAVIAFPPLGHALGMSQEAFGLFAGTAVNDTSSVVAAATIYGDQAGEHAIVVKLVRTLMIIPICLALAALVARRTPAIEGDPAVQHGLVVRMVRLVPWFLTGFVLVAAANSIGLIPDAAQDPLRQSSLFLITLALTSVGLSTDVAALRRAGSRPLLLGAILWVAVSVTSLLIQWVVG